MVIVNIEVEPKINIPAWTQFVVAYVSPAPAEDLGVHLKSVTSTALFIVSSNNSVTINSLNGLAQTDTIRGEIVYFTS